MTCPSSLLLLETHFCKSGTPYYTYRHWLVPTLNYHLFGWSWTSPAPLWSSSPLLGEPWQPCWPWSVVAHRRCQLSRQDPLPGWVQRSPTEMAALRCSLFFGSGRLMFGQRVCRQHALQCRNSRGRCRYCIGVHKCIVKVVYCRNMCSYVTVHMAKPTLFC